MENNQFLYEFAWMDPFGRLAKIESSRGYQVITLYSVFNCTYSLAAVLDPWLKRNRKRIIV